MVVDDVSLYQNLNRVVTFETSLGSRGECGRAGSEVGNAGCATVCVAKPETLRAKLGQRRGLLVIRSLTICCASAERRIYAPRLLTFLLCPAGLCQRSGEFLDSRV